MSSAPVRILVIAGPTAVGKTAFAIKAARAFDGEIVSCDSMQIYKYMAIGSAAPSAEELAAIRHHLIGVLEPEDGCTAARYAGMAEEAIRDISSRGKLPVICGGSGLYLNAILYKMDFGQAAADPKIRKELESVAAEDPQELHRMLAEKDPDAARAIHPNNTKKLIRALERLAAGEGKLSAFSGIREKNPSYDPLCVCLTRNRQELYERIDRRVGMMVDAGLLEEVSSLRERGLDTGYISMLGIGYKEILAYMDGGSSLDEALDRIRKNTRHYAKRQFTWFRRYSDMTWFDISGYSDDEKAGEALIEWLEKRI